MSNLDITFRKATIRDIQFVAMGMYGALQLNPNEDQIKDMAANVCACETTLYSYKNATIAQINGTDVGLLIAYDGGNYLDMRLVTAQICKGKLPFDFLAQEPEASAGELYLDSLWIKPEYQGNGIGSKFIAETLNFAKQQGFNYVTLVADYDNPRAMALYERLGFKIHCSMHLFNHEYFKLAYKLF